MAGDKARAPAKSGDRDAGRIQKVLAAAGLESRRAIEDWIRDGRITVNGKRAKLGDKIGHGDDVCLDSAPLRLPRARRGASRVLVYHKPAGEVCTRRDTARRPTVFDGLPRLNGARWISVGRLDLTAAGLLLFTDDGKLAHRLMHPSSGIVREYAVRVRGEAHRDVLKRLLQGVILEDGEARFLDIVDGGGRGVNHWYYITLARGRNHEVKRLWQSQGFTVNRLIRVRFGPIILPRRLKPGAFRKLEREEVEALAKL